MPPRKPRWDWKAKEAVELEFFDVPFAVKEYLQNQVGQILKEKDVRDWSGSEWAREDLRQKTEGFQDDRKARLIEDYPGLLSGQHGAMLRNKRKTGYIWRPVYILSVEIPREQLKRSTYPPSSSLKICNVVWRTKTDDGSTLMGLSLYNNHLDPSATFSTFVVDGASTSKNTVAVGEKGKGFILASQFLFEQVEKVTARLNAKPTLCGISFRVGNQVGRLQWKKTRCLYYDENNNPEPPQLQVVLEDLYPHDATSLAMAWARRSPAKKRDESDDEYDDDDDAAAGYSWGAPTVKLTASQVEKASKALKSLYKHRTDQYLSRKRDGFTGDVRSKTDEQALVTADEVCITVLGLQLLEPEEIFSAVYGVVPPPQEWRPTPEITLFKAHTSTMKEEGSNGSSIADAKTTDAKTKALFYNRDQLVPTGAPLVHLSINYHGYLKLTADRQSVYHNRHYSEYERCLAKAAHIALSTATTEKDRQLAEEVALDILGDTDSSAGATIGRVLTNWLKTSDGSRAHLNHAAYRQAFSAAWRSLDREISQDIEFYPYLANRPSERKLIREIGKHPVIVSPLVHDILTSVEAYIEIEKYARRLLAASVNVATESTIVGIAQLRKGLRFVYNDLEDSKITFRKYSHSYPRAVWDAENGCFAFARPQHCIQHPPDPVQRCTCYIGKHLLEALRDRAAVERRAKKTNRTSGSGELDDDVEEIEAEDSIDSVFFEAYNHAMNVDPLSFWQELFANGERGIRGDSNEPFTDIYDDDGTEDNDDDDDGKSMYDIYATPQLQQPPAPLIPQAAERDVVMSDDTMSARSSSTRRYHSPTPAPQPDPERAEPTILRASVDVQVPPPSTLPSSAASPSVTTPAPTPPTSNTSTSAAGAPPAPVHAGSPTPGPVGIEALFADFRRLIVEERARAVADIHQVFRQELTEKETALEEKEKELENMRKEWEKTKVELGEQKIRFDEAAERVRLIFGMSGDSADSPLRKRARTDE